jgi:hypothetical protein
MLSAYACHVTLCGTGFTLSILVYQGISKKKAKYNVVQILASRG